VTWRGARVRLAPAYAAYFKDLVGPAKAAGFVPGTPLIELTPFHLGAAVALGAAAPNTLMLGYTPSTARWALSQQDRKVWRDAWLLTATTVGSPSVDLAPWKMNGQGINLVISLVGRSFPADYQLVAVATWPWGHQRQELWRPRHP
jgi:hypothetical protein